MLQLTSVTTRKILRSSNLLDSRKGRFVAFGTLYISEGIPFGFSSIAMVAFMRLEGLSLAQIGAFVAAILLPWGFKWAWAPLVDIVKLKRYGGRKAWISICTSMMIITLVSMAIVDFVTHYRLLVWMVVLNNLFCATQDVAIDSLAVSTLKEDERGTGNGFMFGGQFLGITLGGGGAIYVSSFWGFNAAIIYVSCMLFMSLLFVIFFIEDAAARTPDDDAQSRSIAHFVATLRSFIGNLYTGFVQSGDGPKLGLLFAFLPVGAMALAYAILGTLQVDYGLDQGAIARMSILNTTFAGAGCIIGGMLGDRFGIKKIMALCYLMTMLPTFYVATKISSAGLSGVSIEEFYAVVILHGFFFGGAFAQHAAVFMGMTNPLVAATQFTAYMALSNVAISIGNYWQGIVAENMGYSTALYIDAVIVVAALALIPYLKNRENAPVTLIVESK
jgi:PAT family beta-lactamase induction signal transducer AmpG